MKQLIAVAALGLMLASCGGDNRKPEKQNPAQRPATAAPAPSPILEPAPAPVLPGGLTANEQAGLKDVTGFYGGKCTHSSGTKDNKRYFRIEVSGSSALDSNKQITELNVSNIALLFYKDLQQERDKYDEIRAVIEFEDGQKISKAYSREMLETVVSKMLVVFRMADMLRNRKYDDLGPLLNANSGFATYDKGKLIAQIKSADARLGNVKQFIPYGFMYVAAANKKQVLHISGLLVRDKQNNEFSVDFDPASPKDEAIFLNYKL